MDWKTKKEKAGYRNGTPEEKETDEVALRRRKGEKGGWMTKEAAKDADKGWWFVIMQVKIFHFARSEPVREKNASHDHQRLGGHSGDRNGVSR